MRELISKIASLMLLDIKAVQVSLEKPFKLTSGNFSPVYVNCRSIISDEVSMDVMTAFLRWACKLERVEFDVAAGGESAGIPFASFFAQRLAKPMVYVRKQAREHGLGSLVEGKFSPGARVLLVEDLITDGKSKLSFIEALRNEGAIVDTCIVIFDRLQGGDSLLRQEGVRLISITDIKQLLVFAESENRLSPEEVKETNVYLQNPKHWHELRSLEYIT